MKNVLNFIGEALYFLQLPDSPSSHLLCDSEGSSKQHIQIYPFTYTHNPFYFQTFKLNKNIHTMGSYFTQPQNHMNSIIINNNQKTFFLIYTYAFTFITYESICVCIWRNCIYKKHATTVPNNPRGSPALLSILLNFFFVYFEVEWMNSKFKIYST